MRSSGKKSGAGERVLEGRHVIGLFMLMLLFSGVFFTLGYVMGRNQYDGQVRAATNGPGFDAPDVLPKSEPPPKAATKKPAAEPASDSATPASPPDFTFYHAGDSAKTDDHLKPVSAPSPVSPVGKGAAKPISPALKPNVGPILGSMGGINLQVAALTTEKDAMALANTLRKKNFPTFVQPPQKDRFYHVLVGPYVDQKSADSACKGLEAAGFNKVIVKH